MAKTGGIVKFEGSIEDLIFYTVKGVRYARRKGGISKERIHSEPNFERTRENNSEFGHCSRWGKLLRTTLASLLINAKDDRLVSRMQRVLSMVKDKDAVSVRGQRKVGEGLKTEEGRRLLQGFDFNADAPLSRLLNADWELDKVTGTLHFTDLVPKTQLVFPEGATHARFVLAAVSLNLDTEVFTTVYSEPVTVPKQNSAVAMSLTATNPQNNTECTLYVLAVSFFQTVGEVEYALKGGNGLGVVGTCL